MKFVVTFQHFPWTIARYMVEAMRDEGHSVITVGPYYATWIPWTAAGANHEGMDLPPKYAFLPNFILEKNVEYDWSVIEELHPEVKHADAYIQMTPGWRVHGRPSQGVHCLLATDPHVVGWWVDLQRPDFDVVFNMQRNYMQPTDHYIPYGHSPRWHYYEEREKKIDVMCGGLQYPPRVQVGQWLTENGHKVLFQVGLVGDEYRQAYCESRVAFSWSSRQDTIARVFEGPAIGTALVCNRTPDLDLFFTPGVDCLTFTDYGGAVDACESLLKNRLLLNRIAASGHKRVAVHTYNNRVKWIVDILEHQMSAAAHNNLLLEWLSAVKQDF